MHRLISSLCLLVLACVSAFPNEEPTLSRQQIAHFNQKADLAYYLLPEGIIPSQYDIYLEPNLTEFVFIGVVTVTVNTTKEISEITMHASKLEIKNVVLSNGYQYSGWVLNPEKEFLVISLKTPIPTGKTFSITIGYTGIHGSENVGFYRASYRDEDNLEK